MFKNLVLSGAGVKIFCFIGVLRVLEEKNILKNIDCICGTSAGSILSIGLCLGYTVSELEQLLMNIDIQKLQNINTDNVLNFFDSYGIDDGSKFYRIFKIILKAKFKKEEMTFLELYNLTKKKLVISATCLNYMEIQYFDYEKTPDLDIIDACIMSMSIPILFKPFKYNENYYVDGGLLENYPIDYFKDNTKDTIGILVSSGFVCKKEINNIEDYLYRLFICPIMKPVKKAYGIYKDNTILVENDTNPVNFDLLKDEKTKLINDGYTKALKFFEVNETISEEEKPIVNTDYINNTNNTKVDNEKVNNDSDNNNTEVKNEKDNNSEVDTEKDNNDSDNNNTEVEKNEKVNNHSDNNTEFEKNEKVNNSEVENEKENNDIDNNNTEVEKNEKDNNSEVDNEKDNNNNQIKQKSIINDNRDDNN